jgi:hypothetical protein
MEITLDELKDALVERIITREDYARMIVFAMNSVVQARVKRICQNAR